VLGNIEKVEKAAELYLKYGKKAVLTALTSAWNRDDFIGRKYPDGIDEPFCQKGLDIRHHSKVTCFRYDQCIQLIPNE